MPDPGIVYNSDDCKYPGIVVNTHEEADVVVDNQKADVPGYLEGKGYALFNYNQGISYK